MKKLITFHTSEVRNGNEMCSAFSIFTFALKKNDISNSNLMSTEH